MASRLRLVLMTVGTLAVVAIAVATAGLLVTGGAHEPSAREGFRGSLRPPEVPPTDFRLRDQDGRMASLGAYRGEVVVLTFLYSTCEDTCPIQAQQIRGALDELGSDVPVLALSVDPAGDTPQRARRFLLDQRMAGRMRFLLGSREELRPIWRDYGVQPQAADFDHSAYVLLLDRTGRQRVGFPTSILTPEDLAHDIRLLLEEPA
jgi:protein SCO1